MSEKLTVAELLARNGRGGSSGDSRPRRRHRSLDEGGLSVAELTGSIPVVKDEQVRAAGGAADGTTSAKPAAEKPAAPVRPTAAKPEVIDAELVDETPATPAKPAQPAHLAKQKVAGPQLAEPKPAEPKVAEPQVAEPKAAEPKAAKPAEAEPAEAKPAEPKAAKPKAAVPTTTQPQDVKGVDEGDVLASGEEDTPARPKEFEELEATLKENEVVDYEDNRISWPAMIAQSIGAIAFGMGLFVIFNLLWNNISPIVVLVLALLCTGALVLGVHLLLRHKDRFLMFLALAVGLVLTVGPRLIIGI